MKSDSMMKSQDMKMDNMKSEEMKSDEMKVKEMKKKAKKWKPRKCNTFFLKEKLRSIWPQFLYQSEIIVYATSCR